MGNPPPKSPGASTPENLPALSTQNQDPSLCRSVLWALSAPCGQGAILMGEGPPPAWGRRQTRPPPAHRPCLRVHPV